MLADPALPTWVRAPSPALTTVLDPAAAPVTVVEPVPDEACWCRLPDGNVGRIEQQRDLDERVVPTGDLDSVPVWPPTPTASSNR